ncbi:MAG TPA: hypothetical protein VFA88_03160 [Gaiellaceae bacterium]|nr:hypothetical protein [Gaiellaceae bacterium]
MTEGSFEQLARNQMLFRVLNEQLKPILARSGEPPSFVCECSRGDCRERIALAHDEYADVRAHAAHFAIKPGHDFAEIERIVHENGRFAVVEKIGQAGEITKNDHARAARPSTA